MGEVDSRAEATVILKNPSTLFDGAAVSPLNSGMSRRRVLSIVFFTVFLDLVGFGILIPIQPFLAESLGAKPAIVTLLGAAYSGMQFLFAPFWGRLSDKIGRRPVMLTSIALGALGYALFGFSTTLTWLFAARMLSGFGNANIGAAQAIIADATSPQERAKGMGLIGAAFGLGFIFGPAIGGFFSQYSLATPAYIAAGLGLVNWVLAYSWLPETLVRGARPASERSRALVGFSLTDLKHAAKMPHVKHMLSIFFVVTAGFSLMEQVLGLFIERNWTSSLLSLPGLSSEGAKQAARLTTYMLIVIGFTASIVQGGLIGKLAKRFGEKHLLVTGPLLSAVSFLVIVAAGEAENFSWMYAAAVLMAVGTGLTNPSQTSLLSQLVDETERGTVLGLGQSLAALGRFVGPGVAGWLFEQSTSRPFYVGAALMSVGAITASRLPRFGRAARA